MFYLYRQSTYHVIRPLVIDVVECTVQHENGRYFYTLRDLEVRNVSNSWFQSLQFIGQKSEGSIAMIYLGFRMSCIQRWTRPSSHSFGMHFLACFSLGLSFATNLPGSFPPCIPSVYLQPKGGVWIPGTVPGIASPFFELDRNRIDSSCL